MLLTYSKIKLGVLLCHVSLISTDFAANLIIPDDIEESNNIWATTQNLKDFDFSFDFLLLDRFEDFDNTFLIIGDINALENFRVLAPSNFPHNFIVLSVPAN